MKATTYNSFRDLGRHWHDLSNEGRYKALTVRPRYNRYLSPEDAVYDFVVGHEHVALDDIFCGSFVTMNDRPTLRQYGFTHIRIQYNRDSYTLVALDPRKGPSLNPSARHGRPFA
jgi:hypothetical protein